jgi:hypothetical protein
MKQEKIETITINDVEYVRADSVNKMEQATKIDGMEYCIIRCRNAGVHAGYVASFAGQQVELFRSRRIWHWKGAKSLSELAVHGTADPGNCKFACEIERAILTDAAEILYCTENSRKSIQGVKKWE